MTRTLNQMRRASEEKPESPGGDGKVLELTHRQDSGLAVTVPPTEQVGHMALTPDVIPPSTFTKHLLRARHGAATPATLSQLTLP